MINVFVLGIAYTPLALLSLILSVPSLVIQGRARNFPTIVLIACIAVLNLQNVANAFIWPGWGDNPWEGRIFCDIEIRLYAALPTAVAGADASLFRQLAAAVRTDRVDLVPTKGQRYRKWTFDLSLCVLFPIIVMSTQYFMSNGRFYVVVVIGCTPSIQSNWVAYFLQLGWALLSALIATVYCTIAVARVVRHRRQISGVLATSGMRTDRYIRLFTLGAVGLALSLPHPLLAAIGLWVTGSTGDAISWRKSHPPWWADMILRMSVDGVSEQLVTRGSQIVLGFIVFALFGLGREANLFYSTMVTRSVKTRLQGHNAQHDPLPPSLEGRPNATDHVRLGPDAGTGISGTRRMDNIETELWLADNDGDLGSARQHTRTAT
ncbi:uncharacterized protein HMPREF1541_04924 [Cyphellophora europaea CBS 101466]|uniref:Pheromone a factor receptor n=1 Tax=Cyphellophora europaea (strain CBS 101466) TaxID=1220924 RepID=W2RWF0_CYPE1|nr:uncharacterized protein HMPREF1541_04924 [Cyphellophora europaea CBS 101466]ETN40645.1 hypothetical protein HMPREF1541_04924 [Cyphellophora europaea CBS 101466]